LSDKEIKRINFDAPYYRSKYFIYGIKNNEEALKHWENIGYKKKLITSICDEMKTHNNCLCQCKIKNEFSKRHKQSNHQMSKKKSHHKLDRIEKKDDKPVDRINYIDYASNSLDEYSTMSEMPIMSDVSAISDISDALDSDVSEMSYGSDGSDASVISKQDTENDVFYNKYNNAYSDSSNNDNISKFNS
jgi:hypothetical protein